MADAKKTAPQKAPAKKTTPTAKMVLKESKSVKEMLNKYFVEDVPGDFSLLKSSEKMMYVQRTPEKYVKTRKVNNVQIPYIDHFFAEKCLNFVFGFDWSYSITKENFYQYEESFWNKKTSRNEKRTVIEAEVMMEFSAKYDEKEVKRTIASAHKYYSNPATTRMDAMKSAISKGITTFARQFGVGADIKDKEAKSYRDVEDTIITSDVEKDGFDGFSVPTKPEKPQEEDGSPKYSPVETDDPIPEDDVEAIVVPKKMEEKNGVTEIQDAEIVGVSAKAAAPAAPKEEQSKPVEKVAPEAVRNIQRELFAEMFGKDNAEMLIEIKNIISPEKTDFEAVIDFEALSKKYIQRNIFTDSPIPVTQVRFLLTMVKKNTISVSDIASKAKDASVESADEVKNLLKTNDEEQSNLKDIFEGKKNDKKPWSTKMKDMFARMEMSEDDQRKLLSNAVGKVDTATLTEREAEKIVSVLQAAKLSSTRRGFKAKTRAKFGDDDAAYRAFVMQISGNRTDTSMSLTAEELYAGMNSL